jgi:signal transduction histidine kinase
MNSQGVRSQLLFRDGLARFGPGFRRAAWPAVVVLGLGAEWLARSGQSLGAAGADLAVGWTLSACGLIAWSRRPQSRIGPLIALAGLTWFLGTLAGSRIGPIAALGVALLTLHRGPLFHAIVSYPSGRTLGRVDVFAVLVGYAYAATVPLARNNVVTMVVISLVLVTTIRGYALAAGPERRARVVAMGAAMAVALPLAVGSVERLRGVESPTFEQAVLWGYEVALVLIAVGFLLDLLRGRWAQAAVTRLVVDLGENSETGTLRARLAHALGDQSLTIAYWLPETKGYVDERGDPVAPPDAGSGRAFTLIEQQGERIGALVHEASVLDDADLIDAVASAAKIALSNAHLRAEVRRQVAELDASRRRILEAGDAQRRRLQQDLRVGVGQRLEDVRELLERALQEAHSAADPPGTEGLEDTERQLNQTRVEVQVLAAGIHPPLLSERGLGPALSALAERAPCPVRLVVPPRRLPAHLETTVYFVCSEALTNVAKYARASRVDVEVRSMGDTVTVLIADDGVGGADPEAGSGLMGLADRIEALGGKLLVESPAGGGTRLQAEIPTGERYEEDPG